MVDVSVVIPSLNEAETIGTCIEKVKTVFSKYELEGEIIVADNSDDDTPEIARSLGAVVVRSMKHVDRVVVRDDGSGDMTGEIAEGLGTRLLKRRRSGNISPVRVRVVRVKTVCRYPL